MQESYETAEDIPINGNFQECSFEIIFLICAHLSLQDLNQWMLVNTSFHALIGSDYPWRSRCQEYATPAIELIRQFYQLTSWRETYLQLREATHNTEQSLKEYYIKVSKINRYQIDVHALPERYVPFFRELLTNPEQRRKSDLFHGVAGSYFWRDDFFIQGTITSKPLSALEDFPRTTIRDCLNEHYKLAVHHCRLFAAAATGNNALLYQLIQKREPHIDDIFNTDFFNMTILTRKHPLLAFPLKYNLAGLKWEEASLIDLARFYDQQDILDCYYRIALKFIPEQHRLCAAIACRQSLETISQLITPGQDFTETETWPRKAHHAGSITPLNVAVFFGDVEVVKLLIPHSNVKNMDNFERKNLLLMPLVKKQYLLVMELMNAGVNIDEVPDELICAVINEDFKEILAYPYYPSRQTALGYAFDIAWANNCPAIIKKLLEENLADRDVLDRSHFHWAVLTQCDELIDFVIDYSLNILQKSEVLLPLLIEQALYFDNLTLLEKGLGAGINMTSIKFSQLNDWLNQRPLIYSAATRQKVEAMLHCELLIQQTLKSKNLTNFVDFFIGISPSTALQNAYALEPEYFLHRIDKLLTNPNVHCNKQVRDALLSWQNPAMIFSANPE